MLLYLLVAYRADRIWHGFDLLSSIDSKRDSRLCCSILHGRISAMQALVWVFLFEVFKVLKKKKEKRKKPCCSPSLSLSDLTAFTEEQNKAIEKSTVRRTFRCIVLKRVSLQPKRHFFFFFRSVCIDRDVSVAPLCHRIKVTF